MRCVRDKLVHSREERVRAPRRALPHSVMRRAPTVYILASRRNGPLYVGLTTDLTARLGQHGAGAVEAFTKRANVHRLVYFEVHPTLQDARRRELRLKGWRRSWKIALIERVNPYWRDLSADALHVQ